MRVANDHESLSHCYCADYYKKHSSGMTYTSGVECFCETFECYWFMDIIASYQKDKRFKNEDFQVWEIRKLKDLSAIVTASDGNGNMIVTQKIKYTDFKFDVGTLWLIESTLILPNEY
jgi:hypothetical protein